VRHFSRPRGADAAVVERTLPDAGFSDARREISGWPGYAPTPLCPLDGLARSLGLAKILYKDEGGRFGLGSFKALGGAYAVARLAAGLSAAERARLTVCAATDGNHGRAVAWGARLQNCRCVIFVHEHVSQGRIDAIASYGAEVRRVPGTYDDSVREAAAEATRNGWTVVSDTAWDGYEEIPRQVMHGYGIVADEIADTLGDDAPSHAFVPAGVGGLAASVAARFLRRWGGRRPRFVVVEPETAACCFAAAEAGRPVAVPGTLETVMACLSCGEVSPLAFPVLAAASDDFLAVEDDWARRAMRVLADPPHGDAPVVAGETGAAALAGLLAAVADPATRAALGLDDTSSVLVLGTEGATDPAIYAKIVGRRPEEVTAA
jgi:diaminopropionate ammonia-lyase